MGCTVCHGATNMYRLLCDRCYRQQYVPTDTGRITHVMIKEATRQYLADHPFPGGSTADKIEFYRLAQAQAMKQLYESVFPLRMAALKKSRSRDFTSRKGEGTGDTERANTQ
jgi:hypothetical protein